MSREPDTITLETWQAALGELYQRLMPYYRRSETRERIGRYVLGLLSQTERKNSWQLAETMYESGPQGMQRLLNSADWDVEAVQIAEPTKCRPRTEYKSLHLHSDRMEVA